MDESVSYHEDLSLYEMEEYYLEKEKLESINNILAEQAYENLDYE